MTGNITASILTFVLFSSVGAAATITEEFVNITQRDSTAAVWNFALGEIHPTVNVSNFQVLNTDPLSTVNFDVGDGSHGIFNSSTYGNFGTVAGSVITIDASIFPVLKFSDFNLEPGFTLTSINGPLVIYSLSNVLIDGIINCSGFNGSAASAVTGGASGAGRCGGNSGGNGGDSTTSGAAGLPTGGSVRGGGGGAYAGAAPGSGGGGAGTYSGNAGGAGQNSAPATNAGGSGGVAVANHQFTLLTATPGGGGGSGSNTEGGGGGGGGGGIIIIHAAGNVTITTAGQILARGGNGGAANTGGGGGGGGGGSVKIFTVGNLALTAGTEVDVNGGTGSIPTLVNAGDGGGGSFGRTWIVSSTFSGTGSESHFSNLWSIGVAQFSITPEVTVSKSYDTLSALTQYQSIATNPVSSEIVIEVAGSSDNFAVDNSGWLPASQIGSLNQKRYVKFRLTLTNTSPTVPTKILSASLNFSSGLITDASMQEEFNFKGCGLVKKNQSAHLNFSNLFLTLLLILLPLGLVTYLKTIKTQ